MTNKTNPTRWLIAELAAVLIGTGLYFNYQRSIAELTVQQYGLIGALAVGIFYWGATKIDESDYSHLNLLWYRLAIPVWRAIKQSAIRIIRKIPSLDVILNLFQETQERRDSHKIVSDFSTIAFDELGMDPSFRPSGDEMDRLADEIASETSQTKSIGYRRIANVLFEGNSEDERRIRLILIFCREYVKADDTLETGEAIHDIQSGISRALSASNCDFRKWNDTADKLLSAYGASYGAIHHDEILESDPLNTDLEDSPEDYYGDFADYFLPFRDRTTLNEELVATIIDVVDRGELDQSAVARDMNQYIEAEKKRVRSELDTRDAYLLISLDAGLSEPEIREKIYETFPEHIRFGKTQNKNELSSLPEGIYLTTDAIFTDRDYTDPEQFVEDVKKLVPDEELAGGLMSAYELELKNPAHDPPMKEAREHLPLWTRDSVNAIEFLETGDSSRAVTEIAIDNLLGEQIEVKELLAAIPVNVFADAIPKQRPVINEATEELKDALKIGDLYDWGRYEVEDIAPMLVEKDEENVGTDEEWREIAEQMIEGARQCERAARA